MTEKKPSVKGIDIFLPEQQTTQQQNTEEKIKELMKKKKDKIYEYKYLHKYHEMGLRQTAFWLSKKAIKTLKLYAIANDKTQSEIVEELINKHLPEEDAIVKEILNQ
jgi:hypothetical protein